MVVAEEAPHPSYKDPPEVIIPFIRRLFASTIPLPFSDAALDTMLFGEPIEQLEARHVAPTPDHKDTRYPGELTWDGTQSRIWTPYRVIHSMTRALNLQPGARLADLGAGHGRLAITLGALGLDALAAELLEERTNTIEQVRKKLDLPNVTVRTGNIRDGELDLSDRDFLFMFSPFSPDTFADVFKQLRGTAIVRQERNQEPFTIIARLTRCIEKEAWLRRVYPPGLRTAPLNHSLRYFQPIPARLRDSEKDWRD